MRTEKYLVSKTIQGLRLEIRNKFLDQDQIDLVNTRIIELQELRETLSSAEKVGRYEGMVNQANTILKEMTSTFLEQYKTANKARPVSLKERGLIQSIQISEKKRKKLNSKAKYSNSTTLDKFIG